MFPQSPKTEKPKFGKLFRNAEEPIRFSAFYFLLSAFYFQLFRLSAFRKLVPHAVNRLNVPGFAGLVFNLGSEAGDEAVQ